MPTAKDVRVSLAGTPLLSVDNDSVRLQPFLGGVRYLSDRLYVHGFTQLDFATNGSEVRINDGNGNLNHAGNVRDSNNLFADLGVGYWMYRSQDSSGLTGVIPTLEVHQTTSIRDADTLSVGAFNVGSGGSTDFTSIVAGTTLEFGMNTQATVAYSAPLDGSDRQYDGAFRFMLSRLQ